MVPVAAGGPTKPTTSYQSMQSQPVSKPSTVTVPKSTAIPGTGISLLKGEKTEQTAMIKPLPVETLPDSIERTPKSSVTNTLDVETNKSKKMTEHVATDADSVTSQVETEPASMTSQVETEPSTQQPLHVETSLSTETFTHTVSPLNIYSNGTATECFNRGTSTNQDATNPGANGAKKEAADSSMDTSTQSSDAPKTLVVDLNEEVKTDTYMDDENRSK